MTQPQALELRRIDKWFGANHACRAVSLSVAAGTIHGIVGENGAGKSTVMNIAYGRLRPDRGEVRAFGHLLAAASPRDAIAAGIGMVHQHFMLVDSLSVLENVQLGAEGGFRLARGRDRLRAALERLQRDFRLEVPLDRAVGDLAVGLRQRVEILKALVRGAELLILDEPTAVLTPGETAHFFEILRSLAGRGKTVVMISHKLGEIISLTDAVTVMRRGAVVGERRTAETDVDDLARLMVGRPVQLRVDRPPARPGPSILEVSGLRVTDHAGRPLVSDVSFNVRAGEIVGVAGVAGNGQSELLETLAGLRRHAAGTVAVAGRILDTGAGALPARALRAAGVAHVPEDRQKVGLVTAFTAAESAILGYHDDPAYGRVLLDTAAVTATCRRYIAEFDIRPPEPTLATGDFSGGNQQKLVLARELGHQPTLLLIGQPTRGVDIGAIEFIHRRLVALRDQGKAILVVSSDLDEILALADRILVMAGGRLAGTLPAEQADPDRLGRLMAGVATPDHPSTF
ncbi:MAG: ATP-binding cassette domain-containing protein [Azospirillum sp.]|nr:ATP-binding cassette domain-containing protein [Azospirillum sp.]